MHRTLGSPNGRDCTGPRGSMCMTVLSAERGVCGWRGEDTDGEILPQPGFSKSHPTLSGSYAPYAMFWFFSVFFFPHSIVSHVLSISLGVVKKRKYRQYDKHREKSVCERRLRD